MSVRHEDDIGTGPRNLPAVERRRGERRRRRKWPRLRERRTGFDRRAPENPASVRSRYRSFLKRLRNDRSMLALFLVLTNVLNLADFVLTLDALARGAAEANPIMRTLFEEGAVPAAVFKLSVVLAASLLVWRWRCYRLILNTGMAGLVVFGAVLAYQLAGRALV